MDGSILPASSPTMPRQSRAATITQQSHSRPPVPQDVPGFSVELLGRQLALTGYRRDLIEREMGLIGEEKRSAPLTPGRLQQRQAARAEEATGFHFAALRDLILTCRPATPADAVVQLLVLHGFMADAMHPMDDREEVERERKIVRRILSGAARVIADAHGLALGKLGGTFYGTRLDEEWPDVDLSYAQRQPVTAPCRAMDGTVTEWER